MTQYPTVINLLYVKAWMKWNPLFQNIFLLYISYIIALLFYCGIMLLMLDSIIQNDNTTALSERVASCRTTTKSIPEALYFQVSGGIYVIKELKSILLTDDFVKQIQLLMG